MMCPAMADPDAHELLELAVDAAVDAGALLLERAAAPATGLASKSTHTDLVSDADRAAEALIVGRIRAARPDDAIVAEEGSGTAGAGGLRWLIDPLDGTINYLWRIPHWCVSIAAADDHGALVGVVHDPNRGETFTAARGAGAARDGAVVRLGPGPPLAEALVGTGFNYAAAERSRQASRLTTILPAVRDLRRFGAAALDLAWVAAGRLDGYFETGVAPWDIAAGELLVREAGGEVRALAARSGSPPGVLAARPGLGDPLLALVLAAPSA